MQRAPVLVLYAVTLAVAAPGFSETPASIQATAELDPPATRVLLTPDRFGMVVNEKRRLALVDDLGRAVPAFRWMVSDPSVAQIESDGVVTAIGAGTATITADYERLSATAEVTVYPSKGLAQGAVCWSVRPLPGNTLLKVHPGSPMESEDPDVYFIEKSGAEIVIRALTKDGRQKWTHTVAPMLAAARVPPNGRGLASMKKARGAAKVPAKILGHRWGKQITELMNQAREQKNAAPGRPADKGTKAAIVGISNRTSKSGASEMSHGRKRAESTLAEAGVAQGLLSYVVTDAGNYLLNRFEVSDFGDEMTGRDDLIALDVNRKELWRRSITDGEMGFALHPDGIVYVVEADYENNGAVTLRAIDEFTGTEKFAINLPASFGGRLPPTPGLPSVLTDGKLYLPYETIDNVGAPDVLRLLKVAPDGTYSSTVVANIEHCRGPAIRPNEALPDGHEGVIVTWQYAGRGICAGAMSPVQVTYMPASAEAQQSSLPLAELESYFSDNDGDAVVGMEHLLITDGRHRAVGFNFKTSSIDLNWQAPKGSCMGSTCPRVSIMGIASADRLLVSETGKADGSTTIFVLTPSSGECPKNGCFASSSVADANLVAFDFSDATAETPEESSFTKQYFFKYPTISASPGLTTHEGAGKVSLP